MLAGKFHRTLEEKEKAMIAIRKEFAMSQRFGSRQRFILDLCGPYLGEETEDAPVRCYLNIAHTEIAIDLPAHVLRQYRWGGPGSILLRLPGERVAPVETPIILTESDQQTANGWSAERADFDRF